LEADVLQRGLEVCAHARRILGFMPSSTQHPAGQRAGPPRRPADCPAKGRAMLARTQHRSSLRYSKAPPRRDRRPDKAFAQQSEIGFDAFMFSSASNFSRAAQAGLNLSRMNRTLCRVQRRAAFSDSRAGGHDHARFRLGSVQPGTPQCWGRSPLPAPPRRRMEWCENRR